MTKSDFICAIGGVILIFLRFSKMGTLLSISYIGMSSIPKNRRILQRARAATISFSKHHRDLKNDFFFFSLQKPSF